MRLSKGKQRFTTSETLSSIFLVRWIGGAVATFGGVCRMVDVGVTGWSLSRDVLPPFVVSAELYQIQTDGQSLKILSTIIGDLYRKAGCE